MSIRIEITNLAARNINIIEQFKLAGIPMIIKDGTELIDNSKVRKISYNNWDRDSIIYEFFYCDEEIKNA